MDANDGDTALATKEQGESHAGALERAPGARQEHPRRLSAEANRLSEDIELLAQVLTRIRARRYVVERDIVLSRVLTTQLERRRRALAACVA